MAPKPIAPHCAATYGVIVNRGKFCPPRLTSRATRELPWLQVRMAILLTYLAFNVYVVGYSPGEPSTSPASVPPSYRPPRHVAWEQVYRRRMARQSVYRRHSARYITVGEFSISPNSADNQIIAAAIADPSSLNAIFFVAFNALGVLPAVNLALLLPGSKGQKPLPTAPFVGASFALGFGVRSPP